MNIAEKITRTWNWHGGHTAKKDSIQKIIDSGKSNKQFLKDKIFQGQDKLVFPMPPVEEFSYVEIYSAIREYLYEQTTKNASEVWYAFYGNTPDEFLYNILANVKVTGEREIYNLINLFGRCFNLSWPVKDTLEKQILQTKYASPKLTKQIIQIGKDNNFHPKTIDEILSVMSVIQSFKPQKLSNAKLVLSIDPLDFVTGSLNDYNWSSCTTPDGCHAAMPLGLYMDAFTIIAYIESEKSQYVLFRQNNEPVTGSNKKMRRYIHFNTDYSGLILSKTYPHSNPAFDKALIKIFEDIGYKLETDSIRKTKALNSVFYETHVVYSDMDSYGDVILVMGDNQTQTLIGEEPYCVLCGDNLYYDNEPDFANQGICDSCADRLGLINYYDEDEEYDKEDW